MSLFNNVSIAVHCFCMLHAVLALIIKYRLRIRRAVQGKELWHSQHLGVVAIEKGAFMSPSTMVSQYEGHSINLSVG